MNMKQDQWTLCLYDGFVVTDVASHPISHMRKRNCYNDADWCPWLGSDGKAYYCHGAFIHLDV